AFGTDDLQTGLIVGRRLFGILAPMPKLLYCLSLAVCAAAQQATVPLIVEGNPPIVELSVATASGGTRKARFVVATGGGALLLGSKRLADAGIPRLGEPQKSEGDRFQKLGPVSAKLGDLELDLSGVNAFGMPDHEWLGTRDEAEGMIPARLL